MQITIRGKTGTDARQSTHPQQTRGGRGVGRARAGGAKNNQRPEEAAPQRAGEIILSTLYGLVDPDESRRLDEQPTCGNCEVRLLALCQTKGEKPSPP